MKRWMRAVAGAAAVAAVWLLSACAAMDGRQNDRAAADVTVPYRSGGAGFGGSDHSDMALVPPDKHAPFVAALCLQKAMAAFNAQLVQPDVIALTARDTDVRWQSDIGLLQAEQLGRYNAQPTHPPLRDRLFGVRFSGRLLVVDNELRFSIKAQLSGRGAGEAWQAIDEKDYNGAFFTQALAQALKDQLRATQDRR